MRISPLITVLFLAGVAFAQTHPSAAKLDLSKLSIDQLNGCYRDSTYCGTHDEDAIALELGTRLPLFTIEQLLNCFGDWKICGADEWSLADEIAKRKKPDLLIDRYRRETNSQIRTGILLALYRVRKPEVARVMREALAAGQGSEESLYWPADYLAKQCDPDALHWLATRKGRIAGCLFFSETVMQFGKCRYREAIPYLVTYSFNDACLNIQDEAEHDLRGFYPHSPKEFDSLDAMRKYYCGRARKEGFKLQCDSNEPAP